jgi:hypothetical protein
MKPPPTSILSGPPARAVLRPLPYFLVRPQSLTRVCPLPTGSNILCSIPLLYHTARRKQTKLRKKRFTASVVVLVVAGFTAGMAHAQLFTTNFEGQTVDINTGGLLPCCPMLKQDQERRQLYSNDSRSSGRQVQILPCGGES